MPNRFKLKLSRVIPSFQFCRSKAEAPIPSIYRLSSFNPKAPDINYRKNNHPAAPSPYIPHHHFIKPHASRNVVSVCCRCRLRRKACTHYPSTDYSNESLDFACNKKRGIANNCQAKTHQNVNVVSFFSDDSSGHMSPWTVKNKKNRKKEEKKKKKKDKTIVPSFDSGCFSSHDVIAEEKEETETLLFSSRSFSYDSSYELSSFAEKSDNDTNPGLKKSSNVKKIRKFGRQVSRKWKGSSSSLEITSPMRALMLRRMVSSCAVDGKANESVAVVKKSEHPYEDFKRSMLEMILEKQIFEAEGLEELLQCFLTLNSRQYHGVIVKAFAEIWEVVFCDSDAAKKGDVLSSDFENVEEGK